MFFKLPRKESTLKEHAPRPVNIRTIRIDIPDSMGHDFATDLFPSR